MALEAFDIVRHLGAHVAAHMIDLRDIVAILGRILADLIDIFISLEVRLARVDHLRHGQLLLIENQMLHRIQAVDKVSQTHEHTTVAAVKLRAAPHVILTALDTMGERQGQDRRGTSLLKDVIIHKAALHLCPDAEFDLFHNSVFKFLIRGKCGGVAALHGNEMSVLTAVTVQ